MFTNRGVKLRFPVDMMKRNFVWTPNLLMELFMAVFDLSSKYYHQKCLHHRIYRIVRIIYYSQI